jgi:hypothetical protein
MIVASNSERTPRRNWLHLGWTLPDLKDQIHHVALAIEQRCVLTSTVTTVEWVVATEVVAEVIAETAVVAKVTLPSRRLPCDHSDGVASPVRVLFKRQMVTAALQVILGHRPELFGIRLWTNLRLEAGWACSLWTAHRPLSIIRFARYWCRNGE